MTPAHHDDNGASLQPCSACEPARGCMFGVLFSLPLWGAIALGVGLWKGWF